MEFSSTRTVFAEAGLAAAPMRAPSSRRLEPRAFAEIVVRALDLELDLQFTNFK